MSDLAKRTTPLQAFKAMTAPYHEKMGRSDAARVKLEARIRRACDLYDEEMREVWGNETAQSAPADLAEQPAA